MSKATSNNADRVERSCNVEPATVIVLAHVSSHRHAVACNVTEAEQLHEFFLVSQLFNSVNTNFIASASAAERHSHCSRNTTTLTERAIKRSNQSRTTLMCCPLFSVPHQTTIPVQLEGLTDGTTGQGTRYLESFEIFSTRRNLVRGYITT